MLDNLRWGQKNGSEDSDKVGLGTIRRPVIGLALGGGRSLNSWAETEVGTVQKSRPASANAKRGRPLRAAPPIPCQPVVMMHAFH